MKSTRLPAILILALLAAGGACRGIAQAHVPYADCGQIAQNISAELASTDPAIQKLGHDSIPDIAKHAACFAQVAGFDLSFNLFQFLTQGLKNGTQQSSPSGSSSSTSAVSKPSGTTTLIQDIGGFSATNNGSSLTFQFAPGDLVNQLGKDGVFAYCTASIRTQGCVSPNLLAIFSRATFSATANTSTPGAQVSGTAASSGTAVPATLKTSAETLTFGGIAAKYAFLYKQKAAPATALADPANALGDTIGTSAVELGGCTAYSDWKAGLDANLGPNRDAASIESFLTTEYKALSIKMASDPTCKAGLVSLKKTLPAMTAYQAAIAAQNAMSTSSTPILGVEYDFTTPSNKPSYHSAKLNFSYSIQGKSTCDAQVAVATARAKKGQTDAGAPGAPAHGCSNPSNAAADTSSKPASNASAPSPNWTFSASGSADIYADDPSVTIPSASRLRDIQLGAEVTRVWHWSAPTSSAGAWKQLFSSIGDLSLVGAYYYQDQTSPSILKGPPSSVTFNGLPTTASQVFATRGPINVGQIRFGFGTGKNTTFPVALSYSNRSDLIVHPFVGVQFGISYGLSGK